MIWNIDLMNGVNGIRFGTPRDEVRKRINLPYEEVKHIINFYDSHEDHFSNHCSIEYDSSLCMTAISIFETENIYISGERVFPASISKYHELADDFVKDEFGYTSLSKSIGLAVDGDRILSVTFGKKDYYEFVYNLNKKSNITDDEVIRIITEYADEIMRKDISEWDFSDLREKLNKK